MANFYGLRILLIFFPELIQRCLMMAKNTMSSVALNGQKSLTTRFITMFNKVIKIDFYDICTK